MMGEFDVTCPYCGEMFSVAEDDNYPSELFDDGGNLERKCPGENCGKNIYIDVSAHYEYKPDLWASDELNEEE